MVLVHCAFLFVFWTCRGGKDGTEGLGLGL